MSKKYKHLFFDLDHTLWDFETNSKNALSLIFNAEELAKRGVPDFAHFYECYYEVNGYWWRQYHHKKISKEELRTKRFYETLLRFQVDDATLAERIGEQYLELSPLQTALFPDTLEVLEYLDGKYEMHIITNGFKEVAPIKMELSGLQPYFKNVFISEEIGHQKPERAIFDFALQQSSAIAEESIMIGDNMEADILGAKNAGMDQIYFNPNQKRRKDRVTYEIFSMLELKTIL